MSPVGEPGDDKSANLELAMMHATSAFLLIFFKTLSHVILACRIRQYGGGDHTFMPFRAASRTSAGLLTVSGVDSGVGVSMVEVERLWVVLLGSR